MTSGVSVADEIQKVYSDIKTGMKHRYIIFYIKEEKVIEIEKCGDREESYDSFLQCLSDLGPHECRYVLYDFEYIHSFQGTSEPSKKSKLILMSWCPDTAKIKTKMLYSSSFSSLKLALDGIGKYIQATDMSEASYESVLEKCSALDRS